jgi:hypothetical protein
MRRHRIRGSSSSSCCRLGSTDFTFSVIETVIAKLMNIDCVHFSHEFRTDTHSITSIRTSYLLGMSCLFEFTRCMLRPSYEYCMY